MKMTYKEIIKNLQLAKEYQKEIDIFKLQIQPVSKIKGRVWRCGKRRGLERTWRKITKKHLK